MLTHFIINLYDGLCVVYDDYMCAGFYPTITPERYTLLLDGGLVKG